MQHGIHRPTVVRDLSQDKELEAQVRSGDYFITLATKLDSLTRDVSEHTTRLELEDVVSDLIYMQGKYNINKDLTKITIDE
jgi:hypothetical protein